MKDLWLRLIPAIVFLAAWQLASGWLISDFFFSNPVAIGHAFWAFLQDGALLRAMGTTALEAGLGFLIGGAVGAVTGVLLARSTVVDRMISPYISLFFAIPKVALAPLFIIWFGIGLEMKVILAAVLVFFHVFLNTYTGVRNVSRELVAIFRLMGARESQLIRMVVVPSAFVWVFAGLRMSAPYALIGAIVAEMIASNRGLGWLVQNSAAQFNTAAVFAALIGVVVLALLLTGAIRLLERAVMPWKQAEEQREAGA